MSISNFRADQNGAVAIMFAALAVPVIGLVGLAVDYGFWNQTYASMSLAASGAALNAVKITAAATLANDSNAIAEGKTAGQQWFLAQLGNATNAYHINATTPNVVMTTGATTTATVTYTTTVPSIFGNLFTVRQYPMTVMAAAQISTTPYLNVEILLDNSPSMEIGATPGDIAAMMYWTPCSTPGAAMNTFQNETSSQASAYGAPSPYSLADNQFFSAYQCTGYNGAMYGAPACPITGIAGSNATGAISATGTVGGPSCTSLPLQTLSTVPTPNSHVLGQRPGSGAPCAFACHNDTTAGHGISGNYDYYGVARDTLTYASNPCYALGGSASAANLAKCGITLRFDLVKNAVNDVLQNMQADNISSINNLNVGIFTFADDVAQVYPSPTGLCAHIPGVPNTQLACQAGNQWSTASALVGVPPSTHDGADTGILPYAGANGADTNIPQAMNNLGTNYLSAAGDGSSPTSPLKVLFLVTDGLADYNGSTRVMGAIDSSLCQSYKNMGYTVYVVYTPYYPLMNPFYVSNIVSIAEPLGNSKLSTALQACSSDAVNDYIAADPTSTTSITAALNTFLKRALTSSARFTN